MSEIFFSIGLVIVAAAAVAFIAHLLRQPLVIAYIVTGLVLGPVLGYVRPTEALEAFSALGISFLLFLVGLSMNSRVLKEFGKISLVAGLGQVIFTTLVGYYIVTAMGFQFIEAIYISIALTFSSTIIVVKVLSDKGDLNSLYGKIALGILLVQDFVSIAVLAFLTSFQEGVSMQALLLATAGKTAVLMAVAFISGKYALPKLFDRMGHAHSQELIFLSGIAWMFLFATLASRLGLSVEVGAFLAGVSMAPLPYTYDLSSRIRPLRDFFIVLFFILFGTNITVELLGQLAKPAAYLSLFVLVGNPLIVMILMGALGYRKRTGFLTGISIAQISEFSLIVIAMGFTLGHVTPSAVTLITVVGIVTITGSLYMMQNGERIYKALAPYLRGFERSHIKEMPVEMNRKRYDIIVIGADKMGATLLSHIKQKRNVAALDFNPVVVRDVRTKGYKCFYGDASDSYIIQGLKELRPKLVVSTMPNFDDNANLIKSFKDDGSKAVLLVTAGNVDDALDLYALGADYAVMPHFLGGEAAAQMIREVAKGRSIEGFKKHHMEHLKKRAGK